MEGNVRFINPVALTMYGFEGRPRVRENVLALDNLFEIHYPNGEAVPAESYPAARVLRGETFSGFELWVRRWGDKRRWLASYSGTQVEDSITLGVLTLRDVTRERELEARFRATFEANPTAIAVARLADLRFTEVNDSFLKLTGYIGEEVIGRTAFELRIDIDREKRREALERLQQGETDVLLEYEGRLRTKTGDELRVLSEGRVVNYAGDPHLIDTYLDITERKQNEEQFHQAIQEVMSDTSWFSQKVMERLANLRSDNPKPVALVELSKREREVLERLAKGMNNQVIADELGIAVQTVRNYISVVYDKLDVHSRAEAVVWARERGIG